MAKGSIDMQMANVLRERGQHAVWYGSTEVIDDCSQRSHMRPCHPLEKTRRVLNALERSALFEKTYMYENINGRKRKLRCFKLKNE